MTVLHYSFSLSACPKCHLLICKHTSLADLDFNTGQQQAQCSNTTITRQDHFKNRDQQCPPDGINFYIFPSTTFDNRYSWTTFGTDSNESTNTLNNLSSNNDTICENIPFANENIINSSLLLTPTINQIVRTQSERLNQHNLQKPIYLTKSVSFSTMNNQSTSFPRLQHADQFLTKSHPYPTISVIILLLLIFSYLITNTIDIVLIYIYCHTNYIFLISFISTIILCDMILWINNLIQSNTIPSYLLLIPFSIRLYLLYELLELLIIIFERNENREIFDSLYKIKKQKLYQNLTLFYLIHTGFVTLINLYIWSNNFQLSTTFLLNINYFIPRWIINDDFLSSTSTVHTITTHSTFPYWQISEPVPSSSIFVLISILYYLIINYSLLSTFLIFKQFSLIIILSRLCLIITRLYTFIFLVHLNAWWLSITFILVHLILMITLLFDRTKLKHKRNTLFLQIIFSFITHQSIDDISINALISLENISIFLHRLYLETFSFHDNPITLRLIIFISILLLLQIIGFIFNILSKHHLYRTKIITKLQTKGSVS